MSIRYKLFALVGLLIVLMTLAFAATSYTAQKNAFLHGIDEKLRATVSLARAVVPVDYHDRIVDQNSVSRDEYNRIVDQNNKTCRELELQYLWSCLRLSNQVVFTTATSPGKDVRKADHAAFFEVHRDPHSFDAAFNTMQPVYSTFHNQWGHGRMLLVPAMDRHGRAYCFGASVSLDDIETELHESMVRLLLVAAGVSLVGLI
ncbi:MAG: hypothetical protein WCO56_04720 [Verrucomicrobiota bacterium]